MGRFWAFELKVGKNKATPLQEEMLRQIANAGGIAAVVRSVDEVRQIIEA